MAVVADQNGVVRGTFQIPPNIPAGTKKVELVGAGGSFGTSTFTGSGTVEVQQMRTVEVIETHFYDPLAQTFMLDVGRHLAGVDLWFTAKGTQPVRVQIRETQVGLPSRVVLAEGSIPADQIRVDGQPTRISWAPLWCPAGEEYALVVLTDDATHAVAVAQLGKFDRFAQKWVTQQPYTTGVMLSSSNASTWTPHQDLDMTFRLLGCKFTATAKRVPLGKITAAQVSDLIALARVERPSADTNLTLTFTDEDGDQLTVVDGQVVSLQNRLDGDVTVEAVLTGTDLRSPVLYPGVQAVLGNVKENALYVSRAIDVPNATKIIVAYEVLLTGAATVTAQVKKAGAWVTAPVTGGTPIGDGWQEIVCTLTGFGGDANAQTAVRLNLSGTIIARPRVRNLQVVGL